MEGYTQTEQIPEENIEKNNFDEQWSHPQHVKVIGSDGGMLKSEFFDVYDIKPEDGKEKKDIPLAIALGWTEVPDSHRNHIKYWVGQGREVVVSNTPHGISSEKIGEYPKVETDKLAGLIETLRAVGIEIKEDGTGTSKVNIMGRSEGAIFSIMLAYLYPELVENLVLANPAAMTGPVNIGKFAKRWAGVMWQQRITKYKEKGEDPGNHIAEVSQRDPAQTIASIIAISHMDLREMLKEIRAHGIGVAVIHTTEDKFFPMDKLAGTSTIDPFSITQTKQMDVVPELTAEDVDGFYSLDGTHDSYFYEPEKYAMVIDQALSALEAKKKKVKELKNI